MTNKRFPLPQKKLLFFWVLILLAFQQGKAQSPVITSFTPQSAAEGNYVNINGRGFTNITAVSFGGVPAFYFYAYGDTLIIAYVGAGASGAVKVTTSVGSASLPGFIFIEPPHISSYFPQSGHYGDTITIKGSLLSTVDEVYFGDSSSVSISILSDTVIKAVVGNGMSGYVGIGSPGGYDTANGFTYTGPAIFSYSPTGGSAGTVVKIKGENFTGVTNVGFGNINASSFTINADTLITATVASAASGYVFLQSTKGSAALYGFNVPILLSFNPTAATTNDTVNLHGFNFIGVRAVYFGDSAAASFSVISDTLIKAVVGNGSGGPVTVYKGNDSSYLWYFNFIPYQPLLYSFSPTAATTGDTVNIRGRNFRGINLIRFGSVAATSFSIVGDTLIKAVVGNGNSGYISLQDNLNNSDSIAGFTFIENRPIVKSISPAFGNMGSLVTIKGTRFNRTPASNIVYFGAVKATIVSGNDSTLLVTVPGGATFSEVCVTNNWFTSCSPKPFIVTFPGAMAGFSALSFDSAQKFTTVSDKPKDFAAADFNGDGKTDLALVNDYFGSSTNFVSIYKNTSNSHYISFAAPVNISVGPQGYSGYDAATADFNGDGKMDLLVLNTGQNWASIFINTSTLDSISFAPQVDLVTGSPYGPEGTNPTVVAVKDFDGDGRPDMAFSNFGLDNWCKFSYIRNASSYGNLAFGGRQDYPVVDAYGAYATDLNNDQKPDLAIAINVNGSFMRQIQLANNQSTPGTISFAMNEPTGGSNSLISYDIVFGDLDGDGKTDMVSADGNSSSISVFRNISVNGGYIEFPATPQIITLPLQRVTTACITDADGDGKLDVAVAGGYGDSKILLLKNIGTIGAISFAAAKEYGSVNNPQKMIAADLDNDGKPELIVSSTGDSSFRIFRNNMGRSSRLCGGGSSIVLTSNVAGANYQWQVSTDGGTAFNDISSNSNYSGVDKDSLTLTNLPTSFAGYFYRCLAGSSTSNAYRIEFENVWTGAANSLWNNPINWSCGQVPDANTNVLIRSGNVQVTTNSSCQSITVMPGATVTVSPGVVFTVVR